MENSTQNTKTRGLRVRRGPYKEEVFEEYLNWMSLSTPEKQQLGITTGRDFARTHGISEDRLSKWKRQEGFQELVNERMRQRWNELTPNVLYALYIRCMKYGMASDVELWLAYFQDWTRKMVGKNKKAEVEFTQNDIRALLAPLSKDEQNKYIGLLNEISHKAGLILENND